MKMEIDWTSIRTEYLAGGVSMRALSEKRGVTYAQVRRVAEAQGWAALKAKKEGQPAKEKEPLRTEYRLDVFARLSRAQARVFYTFNGEARQLDFWGAGFGPLAKTPKVRHFKEALLALRFARAQTTRMHPSKSQLGRLPTRSLRELCETEYLPLFGTREMLLKRLKETEVRRLCDLPESVRPLVGAKEIVTK